MSYYCIYIKSSQNITMLKCIYIFYSEQLEETNKPSVSNIFNLSCANNHHASIVYIRYSSPSQETQILLLKRLILQYWCMENKVVWIRGELIHLGFKGWYVMLKISFEHRFGLFLWFMLSVLGYGTKTYIFVVVAFIAYRFWNVVLIYID